MLGIQLYPPDEVAKDDTGHMCERSSSLQRLYAGSSVKLSASSRDMGGPGKLLLDSLDNKMHMLRRKLA